MHLDGPSPRRPPEAGH